MDRGFVGTAPATTRRDEETYLDFVEGARTWTMGLEGTIKPRADEAFAAFERESGRAAASVEDAASALDEVAIIASRKRLMRSTQEMLWSEVIASYRAREQELLAELDAADRSGPGSVRYDPAFRLPDYITNVDFHIQPGSYDDDPLAGYIYHYGTKIFFTGHNDNDDVQRIFAQRAPAPEGETRRVLDLGCSVGQSTTALKERFPQAEVWGIDAGLPMVRYAHKRAIDMGLDVHFAQALAEGTGFPDESFDLIYSYILFHELPVEIGAKVVAEAKRLLRPGGHFVVCDFGTLGGPLPAYGKYALEFSRQFNGEPYAFAFVESDFNGLLRKAGFSRVEDVKAEGGAWGLPMRLCVK
jgi:SAM-dependent methyltransferase